jgi:hypothetical protein
MLFTAVGALAVLAASRLPRSVKLIITFLLAATAGGAIPLATMGLFSSEDGGYGLLLALAVISMQALAQHIPRTSPTSPEIAVPAKERA